MQLAPPEAILPPENTRGLTCVQWHSALIDPKYSSKLYHPLTFSLQHLPPITSHLKRIRKVGTKNCVLISPITHQTRNEVEATMAASGIDYEIQAVDVPEFPACTRIQFNEWNRVWPLSWKVCTDKIDTLTDDETETYQIHMGKVIEMYKLNLNKTQGSDSSCCEGRKSDIDMSARTPVNVCIIVDPMTSTIVASSTTSSTYPLHHAAMVAINSVAASQQLTGEGYLCTGFDVYMYREPCWM
jgi:tRNA-specific adenosine deaminase 3